jgi:hypothetical protein
MPSTIYISASGLERNSVSVFDPSLQSYSQRKCYRLNTIYFLLPLNLEIVKTPILFKDSFTDSNIMRALFLTSVKISNLI